MKCSAAHDLDIEVAFVQHPYGGLTHSRERLWHQAVQVFPVLKAFLEGVGLLLELSVGHLLEVLFDQVDLIGNLLQLPQLRT